MSNDYKTNDIWAEYYCINGSYIRLINSVAVKQVHAKKSQNRSKLNRSVIMATVRCTSTLRVLIFENLNTNCKYEYFSLKIQYTKQCRLGDGGQSRAPCLYLW